MHKHSSIASMLDSLPPDELEITEVLRRMVHQCVPGVNEYLAYSVPHFKRRKPICFIWPGAVFWGDSRTYDGVRFGFSKGYLLSDPYRILEKDGRKQVFWVTLKEPRDLPVNALRDLLFEAALLDEAIKK